MNNKLFKVFGNVLQFKLKFILRVIQGILMHSDIGIQLAITSASSKHKGSKAKIIMDQPACLPDLPQEAAVRNVST